MRYIVAMHAAKIVLIGLISLIWLVKIFCVLYNSLEELAPEGVRKLSHHVGLSIHPAFNLQMLITHYIYRVQAQNEKETSVFSFTTRALCSFPSSLSSLSKRGRKTEGEGKGQRVERWKGRERRGNWATYQVIVLHKNSHLGVPIS